MKATSCCPARSSDEMPAIDLVSSAPSLIVAPVNSAIAATTSGVGGPKKVGSPRGRLRKAKRAADPSTAPFANRDRSKSLAGAEAEPLRGVRSGFGERVGEVGAQEPDRRGPEDRQASRRPDGIGIYRSTAPGGLVEAPQGTGIGENRALET